MFLGVITFIVSHDHYLQSVTRVWTAPYFAIFLRHQVSARRYASCEPMRSSSPVKGRSSTRVLACAMRLLWAAPAGFPAPLALTLTALIAPAEVVIGHDLRSWPVRPKKDT